MTEADWIKLALLCLAGAASPGLSWLLILSMSASKGTRVGISGALGHGLGITAFALITVFGLSVLLIAMPKLTSALTLLGIGLLVFFGYQLVTAGKTPLPEGLTTRGGFIAGFSIAIVNPKVLVFFSGGIWTVRRPHSSDVDADANGTSRRCHRCGGLSGCRYRWLHPQDTPR